LRRLKSITNVLCTHYVYCIFLHTFIDVRHDEMRCVRDGSEGGREEKNKNRFQTVDVDKSVHNYATEIRIIQREAR